MIDDASRKTAEIATEQNKANITVRSLICFVGGSTSLPPQAHKHTLFLSFLLPTWHKRVGLSPTWSAKKIRRSISVGTVTSFAQSGNWLRSASSHSQNPKRKDQSVWNEKNPGVWWASWTLNRDSCNQQLSKSNRNLVINGNNIWAKIINDNSRWSHDDTTTVSPYSQTKVQLAEQWFSPKHFYRYRADFYFRHIKIKNQLIRIIPMLRNKNEKNLNSTVNEQIVILKTAIPNIRNCNIH